MATVAIALVVFTGLGLALMFKIPALIASSVVLAVIVALAWNHEGWPFLEGLLKTVGLLGLLQTSYVLGLCLGPLVRRLRRRLGRRRNDLGHGNGDVSDKPSVRTSHPSA